MSTATVPRPAKKSARSQQMVPIETTRSASLASGCYATSQKTKQFLQALTDDLLNGRLPDRSVNTAVNVTRSVLRVVEMEITHAAPPDGESPNLQLIPEEAPNKA